MIKISPKYLNFENISKKCIRVPSPLHSLFLIISQVKNYQSMLKLSCRPVAFTSYKSFLKTKRGVELVPPAYTLIY